MENKKLPNFWFLNLAPQKTQMKEINYCYYLTINLKEISAMMMREIQHELETRKLCFAKYIQNSHVDYHNLLISDRRDLTI